MISDGIQYPHVFEETVLDKIKGWVMDGSIRSSTEDHKGKNGPGLRQSSDSEMLKTYSTGLLAVCLAGYVMFLPTCYLIMINLCALKFY